MKLKAFLIATSMGIVMSPATGLAQTQNPFVFNPNNTSGSQTFQARPQVTQNQGQSQQQMPQILDDGSAARAAVQNQGIYSPLPRGGAAPLGITQDAWNNPRDNMADGQHQPGVVRFAWSTDLVMPVRIREAMVTSIVIPEWDGIADVIIGDGASFEAMKLQPNVAGIRALATGVDTTIQVIGKNSGNLYTFYVRSETYNTETITDLLVYVNVPRRAGEGASRMIEMDDEASRYPSSVGEKGARFAPFVAKDPLPEEVVFDLTMYGREEGDDEIAPELVYTDPSRGWTYFDFGKKAHLIERPVVFQLKDGIETRVNTRTIGDDGEILVVESVGEFVLRAGQKVVCVKKAASGS